MPSEYTINCVIISLHQNPTLPTGLFFMNFWINWIAFAGTFGSTSNKPSNLRKIWILSINESNVKINKRTEIGQSGCSYYHCVQTSASDYSSLGFVLIMVEFSDFSLHLFDDLACKITTRKKNNNKFKNLRQPILHSQIRF